MTTRKYDLILYGATGFTGKIAAIYLASLNHEIKIALAGRSLTKLKTLQKELLLLHPKTIFDLLPAESSDYDGLLLMTQQTKVILTTVGPFELHGKLLVKACVQSNTHYIDSTGELQFVKESQVMYNDTCKKNKTFIVSCCGFDCIPSDISVYLYYNN